MPLEVSADPVYPEEAIRFFRGKIGVTEDEWDALEDQNHDLSFKLAGIADIDVIDDVYSAIDDAITNGTTLEDFRDKVIDELMNSWGGSVANPGWRVETIFRTNLQSAYQAGHYAQAQQNKEDRPFGMLDVVEDGRTSDICADLDDEIGGRAISLDDPIWSKAWPPNHFNALTADTLVETEHELVPISLIQVGDRVLTHTGHYQRVTATSHKLEFRKVFRIETNTGRVIRATPEHPVLTHDSLGGSSWRLTGDLKVGDHLFEYVDEMPGVPDYPSINPVDAPPLTHEGSVPVQVTSESLFASVVLPIHLDGDLQFREGKVKNEPPRGILWNCLGDESSQVLFAWGEISVPGLSRSLVTLLKNPRRLHRVVSKHPLGGVRAESTSRPVISPGPLGNNLRESVGDSGLSLFASDSDPVSLTPLLESSAANPQTSLNRPDALSSTPMLGLNQSFNSRPIRQVNWHDTLVTSIVEETIEVHHLCDLSVEVDETYVAGGVIVHNCRSSVITMDEQEAIEAGFLEDSPDPPDADELDVDEDFDHAPGDTLAGLPDPEEYPEELQSDVERFL